MSRNTYVLDRNNKLTLKGGLVVPIMTEQMLPGDVMKGKADILVRLAPQVAPVMDSVTVKTYFFYMPYRLFFKDDSEWTEWYSKQGKIYLNKDFKPSEFAKKIDHYYDTNTESDSNPEYMNENFSIDIKFPHCRIGGLPYMINSPFGAPIDTSSKNYVEHAIESATCYDDGSTGNTLVYTEIGSLADYLGIPVGQTRTGLEFSPFPFEMYRHIYNEYFRDVLKYDEVKPDFFSYDEVFNNESYVADGYVANSTCFRSVFNNSYHTNQESPSGLYSGVVMLRHDDLDTYTDGTEGVPVPLSLDVCFASRVLDGDPSLNDFHKIGIADLVLKVSEGVAQRVTNILQISNVHNRPITQNEIISLIGLTYYEYPIIDPILMFQSYGGWINIYSNIIGETGSEQRASFIETNTDFRIDSATEGLNIDPFLTRPDNSPKTIIEGADRPSSSFKLKVNSSDDVFATYISTSYLPGKHVYSQGEEIIAPMVFSISQSTNNDKNDRKTLPYQSLRTSTVAQGNQPRLYHRLQHNYNVYNNLFFKSSRKDMWTQCLTDPSYYGLKYVVPINTAGQFLDDQFSTKWNAAGDVMINSTGLDLQLVKMYTRIGAFFNYLANVGDRYEDQLQMIYGTRPSDLRLRKPVYVGGGKSRIIFSEVVNTSGEGDSSGEDGEGVVQGKSTGYGFGLSRNHGFEIFAREHGLVMGVMCIIPNGTNYGGLPNSLIVPKSYYDIPNPYFSHMEHSEVLVKDFLPSKFGSLYNHKNSFSDTDTKGYSDAVLSTGNRVDFLIFNKNNLERENGYLKDLYAIYSYNTADDRKLTSDQVNSNIVRKSVTGTYLDANVYNNTFGYQKQWYRWKNGINEVHGQYLTTKRNNHLTRFFNEIFPRQYFDEEIQFRGNYSKPLCQSLMEGYDTTMPGLNTLIFNSFNPIFELGTFDHPFWCDINFKISCSRVA